MSLSILTLFIKSSHLLIETQDRLLYVNSIKNYFKAIRMIKNSDKVILHGFGAILPWYFPLYYVGIKKSSWVIWGWDLYHYKVKEKNPILKIMWWLRDILLNEIPEIIRYIREEFILAKEAYNINPDYKFAFYPNPLNFEMLDRAKDNKGNSNNKINKKIRILVGNSASPTNNHIDIFEKLCRFKKKDIKLIVPLSYGNMKYAEKVKKVGEDFFGEKFIPLNKKLSPEKYSEVLSSVDVCVMNHNRQQGMGNIKALLYLGKKVYIRYGYPHQKFLSNNNIKVFNTDDILKESFEEVVHMDSRIRIKNTERIKKIFSEKSCFDSWKKIF